MGNSLAEVAPSVLDVVPPRIKKIRLVADALSDQKCIMDIQGNLSMVGLYEFFQLWDALQEVTLSNHQDQHIWHLSNTRNYSTSSAYQAFFQGSVTFEPWRRIWKTWASTKCKIFIWLEARNRCWTADRLAKKGLPHPSRCVFCDQGQEDIQHILTCVMAREFWFKVLSRFGLSDRIPKQSEKVFAD
jgi:hypothetical protein